MDGFWPYVSTKLKGKTAFLYCDTLRWWYNDIDILAIVIYCIAGKFGKLTFQAFGERKFGELKRSANRLSIENTNLDDFSLVNHGQFAKFTKLSCYSVNYIGASIYTNFGGWCTILNDFYCITVVIKIFTT